MLTKCRIDHPAGKALKRGHFDRKEFTKDQMQAEQERQIQDMLDREGIARTSRFEFVILSSEAGE